MSEQLPIKALLEAGAHFGHQTSRWNPKMRPYIFASKGGVHIIDLQQTQKQIEQAKALIEEKVANGGYILFVGTKKQAREVVRQAAESSGQFYVTNRWLGGMLTNFKTMRASIDRLKTLEEKRDSDTFEKLLKKERLMITREIEKLERNLSGIKTMTAAPAALFIIDPKKESIAQKEAKRLKIPVIAMVDSNCDPDGIDYVIAANDDAIRSIQLIVDELANACQAGRKKREAALAQIAKEKELQQAAKAKEKEKAAANQEREIKEGDRKEGYVAPESL